MAKDNKKLYIKLLIIFGIIFIASIFFILKENRPISVSGEVQNKNFTSSATIIAGDITAHISFEPDTIFYDALLQAKKTGHIEFSGRDYPSLGFFVTDIGTLHSGEGKNLIYYINGKEATVGVSTYRLHDGDVIKWKLE